MLIGMDAFGTSKEIRNFLEIRKRNEFPQLLSFILTLCKANVPTPQQGEQYL